MELNAVAASVLRRWYLVLVGLAMTTGLVFLAAEAVPPTYSATGSVVLLPPGAAVTDGSNPLLQLGGLEQPASLVVAYLAGDEVRKPFEAEYPDTTYDVVLDPLSRGPLIIMTVFSPTPDSVLRALDTALAEIPTALTNLQDRVSAPVDSRVESVPLSIDPEPTTLVSKTLRAVIAAAGVGVAGTLVGTVSLDRLLWQRRARRTGRPDEDEDEDVPVGDEARVFDASSIDEPGPVGSDDEMAPVESEDEELSVARSISAEVASWTQVAPAAQPTTSPHVQRSPAGRLVVPWA